MGRTYQVDALCFCAAQDALVAERALSDALAEDSWTGRSGFVHRAVVEDFPDLSGHQVYACGVPVMVDASSLDFTTRCGLPENEFYADSLTTAADRPA